MVQMADNQNFPIFLTVMIVSENDGRLPIYFTKVRTNDLPYTLGGIWENL